MAILTPNGPSAEAGAADESMFEVLSGRRLPVWGPGVAAAAAIVIAAILFVTGINNGVAQTVVLTVLLFIAIQSVWSFKVEGRRHAMDRFMTTLIYAAFIIAMIPLLSIMYTVISNGLAALNAEFFTETMRNVNQRSDGGGIAHAIVGTIEQVLAATAMAVPLGVLVAIYLVEYGKGKLAMAISFFVDVMTGVPSIVAGLFIYTGLVLTFGMQRSGFAASLALVILMLPVVVRTSEEMLKLVPMDLREASYALGVPKWITILKVVVPTALPGMITGIMLAVARVAGETAPLLLTTFLTQSMNWNLFDGPQTALPTFVWDQISSGTDASISRAWGGALVLIMFVAILYIGAKLIARAFQPKAR